MDRREAMLREMNLYPLWVRREQPAAAREEAPVVEVSNALEASGAETAAAAAVVAAQAADVPVLSVAEPTFSGLTFSGPSGDESSGSEVPGAEVPRAEMSGDVASASSETESGNTELPPVADLFASQPDKDAQFVDMSLSRQERKDSLLEFQQKHAGGALANLDRPELKTHVHDCQLCTLRAACTQPVFGSGDQQADWLFIGEAPGDAEDAQDEPFVGEAGSLLDNMLMAIKLRRGENVYIANVIKCRPSENRHPHVDEIALCLPYLKRQIALIQPKLIVLLGKTAATALLGSDTTLGSLRGTLHDYQGIPVVVTYHPAYLLRKPTEKARAWEDLCLAVATLRGGGSI